MTDQEKNMDGELIPEQIKIKAMVNPCILPHLELDEVVIASINSTITKDTDRL